VKESIRELYGYLYLTDYKLKFVPEPYNEAEDNGLFDIPYGYVLKYEEIRGNFGSDWYLLITLKDARTFKFKFD
jgi:hypothetical protein